jgi:hypothetical protein
MRGKGVSPRMVSSEIPLERKLGLPARSQGIVNDPEVFIVIVAVGEAGPEVRVIQEIEELSSKLEVRGFCRPESLEDRKIKSVVGWTMHLVPRPSQGRKIGLPYGGCGRRLNKPCSIQERLDAMGPFLRVRISCDRSIAAEVPTHCAGRAVDRKREPILRGENPLSAPTADHCVESAGHAPSK